MPKDSKGKFHLNTQRAMAADKQPAKKPAAPAPKAPAVPMGGGLEEMGEVGEPPAMEAAEQSPVPEHLSAMHAQIGGKHLHVHSDGIGGPLRSHQVGHDGAVEGPHDHENMEALKAHMEQFLTEEENEAGPSGY